MRDEGLGDDMRGGGEDDDQRGSKRMNEEFVDQVLDVFHQVLWCMCSSDVHKDMDQDSA